MLSNLRPHHKQVSSFLAACALGPLLSACFSSGIDRSLEIHQMAETRVLVIDTEGEHSRRLLAELPFYLSNIH